VPVRKRPLGDHDVQIVANLLDRISSASGVAPPATVRSTRDSCVCLAGIVAAVERHKAAEWMRGCEVWLYRGAWQEWEPDKIEMAVP